MLLSFVVYTFLLIILVFLGYVVSSRQYYYSYNNKQLLKKNTKVSSKYLYLMYFIYALFAGIRYDVGVDHLAYIDNYIYGDVWGNSYEFGFQFIMNLCKFLGFTFPYFFFIVAFIQIYFYLSSFSDNAYIYPLLIFFFFCNGEWSNFNNIIRCMLAAVVWLYSIRFIQSRQLWFYLMAVIIASLFHKSAIILLICYPLLYKGYDYFKSPVLQIILLFVVLLCRSLFYDYIYILDNSISTFTSILGYEDYTSDVLMDSVSEKGGTGIVSILKIGINCLIISSCRQLKQFYVFNKGFITTYNIYFVGSVLLLYIFPDDIISLSRPFRYFYLFQNIMFAYYAYYLYHTSKINRILFYILICTFLGVLYYSILTASQDSHFLYKFYFNYV